MRGHTICVNGIPRLSLLPLFTWRSGDLIEFELNLNEVVFFS